MCVICIGEPLTVPPLLFQSRLKMATSSERSPPPFPDSEDQDVLDSEDVQRDSDDDDDLFMSTVSLEVVTFTPARGYIGMNSPGEAGVS